MKIDFDYFADWIIQKSSFMKRWFLSITIYFYSESIVICEKISEGVFNLAPSSKKQTKFLTLNIFKLK